MSGKTWAERETMARLRELGSSDLVVIATERCTIGRDPSNNVVVSGDPCVSRFHSVIIFEDGDYFIGDAGSWNGTIVNGEKVLVRRQMQHGDKIRVGLTRFEFILGISAEKAASIAVANGLSHEIGAGADSVSSQTVVVCGLNGGTTDLLEDTHSLPDRVKPHGEGTANCRGDITAQMSIEDRVRALPESAVDGVEDTTGRKRGARMPELPVVKTNAVPPAPVTNAQHEARTSEVPDWCAKYFELELKQLEDDLVELKYLAAEIAQRTQGVANKIAVTQDVRNALFLKSGDEPISACERIFQLLGWSVTASSSDRRELYLSQDGKIVAIARILSSSSQTDREALNKLAVSQIEYWCQHRFEPKGLLILTEPGIEPRFQLGDSNSDLVAYAEAKSICLIEAFQFLSIYREIALRQANSESFRKELLVTNGRLSGLSLEPSRVPVEI